jgi:hypothetical protein
MKPFPAIAAATIAVALLLVPLSAAAAGTISFTSPASGASYKGTQSYSISGTISPAPTQADNVGIVVKNPGGVTVDQGNVAVTSGSFSYATVTGSAVNPASWPSGLYTITAQDAYGATGSTTFQYTSTSAAGYNVTRALVDIQGNLTQIKSELTALQSAEALEQTDMKGNFTALNTAIGNAVTTLTGQITGVSNSITTLTQNLATLSGTVTTDYNNLTGQVSTLSSTLAQDVSTLQSAVNAASSSASTAATDASAAQSAVSSTQTYVLVVAVLAAITLVLELAILVRKLS